MTRDEEQRQPSDGELLMEAFANPLMYKMAAVVIAAIIIALAVAG
jgi:hypothetical protein